MTITAADTSGYGSTASQTFEADLLATTTTTVTAVSPATVTDGSPVMIEATVSPVVSGNGIPTGNVDFYDGATDLGSVSLDTSGQASLTLPSLGLGDHGIAAVYDGDDTFAAKVRPPRRWSPSGRRAPRRRSR